MIDVLIYFFSALAAISALYILFTSNILYAAFALVITFLAIAILYILANADFVAATQIMIYVGGIVVVIIFGVMLTNKLVNSAPKSGSHNKFIAFIISGVLFTLLTFAILDMNLGALGVERGNIQSLGYGLMTNYLLPFEMAAILLLLALIGATVIVSQKNVKK